MQDVASWAGRTVLDVGCGTGFHLPWFAETAASVVGVEPHADLVALARRRTRRLAERRRPPGHRAGAAGAGRVGRRRARPVGLLLRPRLRARAGRAGPRRTTRRHGVRDRQRRDPLDVRRAGSAAATRRSTRSRSSGSGRPAAGPGRRSTCAGRSRRAPTSRPWSASSSSPSVADAVLAEPRGHRGRLRRQPLVAALLSRLVRDSLRCKSSRAPRGVGASSTPGPTTGGWASSPCERRDDLDGDLLERLPHRRQAGRHDLGDLGVVEADDRDVPAGAQPAVGQRVQDAHRQGVGGAHERRRLGLVEQHARWPRGRSPRCPRPGTRARWSAARARASPGSSRSGGPRRSRSPCASRSRRSGGGRARAGGWWPARCRRRRRRRPTGAAPRGCPTGGRTRRTAPGAPRARRPAGCRGRCR